MDFASFGDDAKGLVRFDPRTKLYVFLTSCLISIHCWKPELLLAYAVLMGMVMALCGRPAQACKMTAAYMLALYVRHVIQMSSSGAGFLATIVGGLAMLLMFMMPFAMSFLTLVQTTRVSHFLAALQHMHVPATVTIPIAVVFRFVPTVSEEWDGIRKAMSFRGISLDLANVLRHPAQMVEYMVVPLLLSSVSVMEELASAAMARGLDASAQRTSYEEVHMASYDYAVVIAYTATLVVSLAYGQAIAL